MSGFGQDASPENGANQPPTTAGCQVLGIGTDIIECLRIARMIERHGELFLHRVYTPAEIGYCSPRRARTEHYAGRWAAKEAVLKALGTGWSRGIQWTDVEVYNQPGGQPIIRLHHRAAEIADQSGIDRILISITHCRHYAVAFATALAKP
jgi:holo-[acyl-carrier protein] synthase